MQWLQSVPAAWDLNRSTKSFQTSFISECVLGYVLISKDFHQFHTGRTSRRNRQLTFIRVSLHEALLLTGQTVWSGTERNVGDDPRVDLVAYLRGKARSSTWSCASSLLGEISQRDSMIPRRSIRPSTFVVLTDADSRISFVWPLTL